LGKRRNIGEKKPEAESRTRGSLKNKKLPEKISADSEGLGRRGVGVLDAINDGM